MDKQLLKCPRGGARSLCLADMTWGIISLVAGWTVQRQAEFELLLAWIRLADLRQDLDYLETSMDLLVAVDLWQNSRVIN